MNKRLAMRLKGNEYRHMVAPMVIAHILDHHGTSVTVACVEGGNWSTLYTREAVEIIEAAIAGKKLPVRKRRAQIIASFLAELNEVLVAAHLAHWPAKVHGIPEGKVEG